MNNEIVVEATPVVEDNDPQCLVTMTRGEFHEAIKRGVIDAHKEMGIHPTSVKDRVFKWKKHPQMVNDPGTIKTPVGEVVGMVGNVAHAGLDVVEAIARCGINVVTAYQSRRRLRPR